MTAAISFDFRRVAGDLSIVSALNGIIRKAPRHWRFLSGLAELGTEVRTPLGFRQRLTGPVDVKMSGLLPIQNLARYFAFAAGFTPTDHARPAHGGAGGAGPRQRLGSSRCARPSPACPGCACRATRTPSARAGRRPTPSTPPRCGRSPRPELQEALRVVAGRAASPAAAGGALRRTPARPELSSRRRQRTPHRPREHGR